MNVIIAIGHDGARDNFAVNVSLVIARLGTLHARIDGPSFSEPWGTEDATWFAAEFESFDVYAEARARILAIGAANNQDAIAFTIGTTDVADCPRVAEPSVGLPTREEAAAAGLRYRDFL